MEADQKAWYTGQADATTCQGDPVDQIPSIADKVRFWQEQDQINQALIPRVVKLHDTVAELSRQLEGIPTTLAAMESRLKQQVYAESEKLAARALDTENRVEQHGETLSKLAIRVVNLRRFARNLPGGMVVGFLGGSTDVHGTQAASPTVG